MGKKLTLLVIASILAFVLFEIALRIYGYTPDIRLMDIYKIDNNENLPYTLTPDYNGYFLFRKVHTDHAGHRLVVPDIKKPDSVIESEKNILIVGDSVVFGWGLDDNETIASQLQSLLNEKGLNYTVSNIGVPSYSTRNEYEAIKQYTANHDVGILILVMVANDLTYERDSVNTQLSNHQEQFKDYSSFRTFIFRNVYSVTVADRFLKRFTDSPELGNKAKRERLARESAQDWHDKYLADEALLNYWIQTNIKIKQLCDQKGIRLIVAIPRFHYWYRKNPDFNLQYENTITQRLENAGISAHVTTSHTDNLTYEQINVFPNDMHPSPTAVKYFVNDLYEIIAK